MLFRSTDNAVNELKEIENIIINMFDNLIITLENKNEECIENISELEDRVDYLCNNFQENHIKRLNDGSCNIDSGVIYIDIISHLERIADHIYKIAMYTKDELFGGKRGKY